MDDEVPTNIKYCLIKLCTELQLFLNKTEADLFCAQEVFKQAENVLKPWKISKSSDAEKEKCLCKTLETVRIAETVDSVLLNEISKTLNTAEEVRRKASKSRTQISKASSQIKPEIKKLQRSSETCLKNKPKTSLTSKKSFSSNDIHGPCCPLFDLNNETKIYFTLPEALDFYKIPNILIQTIQKCDELVNRAQKSKSNPKDVFLKTVEAQNEKRYALYKEKDCYTEIFFEYLTLLNSEKKSKHFNCDALVFYKDIKYFEQFQILKSGIIEKESWLKILELFKEFLPSLQVRELNEKQKIFFFRIVETVCNFVQSKVPTVPLIHLQTN